MTSIPFKRSALPLVLGGILLGALGTAGVMSAFRPTTKMQAPVEAKEEAHHADAAPLELSEVAAKTAGIRVEAVRYAPIGEGLTVPGTVELSSNRTAKVTPPAPGKVIRLLVNLGDTVRLGQPLAVLDSFEVAQSHAAAHQAEASVQQANAGIQTAEAEVDQALAGVKLAEAEVAQAQDRQASAETALQRQRDLAKA